METHHSDDANILALEKDWDDAYYEGEPELVFETDEAMTAFKAEIEEAAKKDGAPMGFDWDSWEEGDQGQDEVPSILSERAGLRRYYIGQAC